MIYTFYSFKGGVGRSMALASVAYLLASRGLKVLTIDFDLEAPGLERYFFDAGEAVGAKSRPGLIDLLQTYKRALTNEEEFRKGEFRDWSRFVQKALPTLQGGGCVDIMTAGQREPPERYGTYATAVRNFDWLDFFHHWKGERFFDWLRGEFIGSDGESGAYDAVLVDSRTGITEMGGVCTYQLADVAVMLCAANDQNLEGTLHVAQDFRSDATLALRRGRRLDILVIPARLEANNAQRAKFLQDFQRKFDPASYLPKQLAEVGLTYERLALPYEPKFAIIEQIVGEQATAGGVALAAISTFQQLANALTLLAFLPGRLRDTQAAARNEILGKSDGPGAASMQMADPTKAVADYDVFLDGPAPMQSRVAELGRGLTQAGVRVATLVESISAEANVASSVSTLLQASRAVMVLLHTAELSAWTSALIDEARKRLLPIIPLVVASSSGSEGWRALRAASLAHLTAVELDERRPDSWTATVLRAWLQFQAAAETPTTTTEVNPYPGSRPFTEADAKFFFGRAAELDALRKLVDVSDVALLVGAASIGKTSLVRAGLLPTLRGVSDSTTGVQRRSLYIDLASENQPEHKLGAWLESTAGEPGLLALDSVDSFPDTGTTDAVIDRIDRVGRLLDVLPQSVVALLVLRNTLEAEHLVGALARWKLQRGGRRSVRFDLAPMDAIGLAQAIEKPAARLGHVVDPGLATLLVSQAGVGQGAVAELARALPMLWDGRRRGWLTAATLESQGGIHGLFGRAWAAFVASLSPQERDAAHGMVRVLSRLDGTMRWTSSPGDWSMLVTVPVVGEVDAVALRDRMAGQHLIDLWCAPSDQTTPDDGPPALPRGEPLVALVHELPSLYGAEHATPFDPSFLLWRSQFASYVNSWQRAGRISAALLPEQALAEAELQRDRHPSLLSEPERSLIEQSRALRLAQERADAERNEIEAATKAESVLARQKSDEELRRLAQQAAYQQKLRWIFILTSLTLSALLVWAVWERGQAQADEKRATAAEEDALKQKIVAQDQKGVAEDRLKRMYAIISQIPDPALRARLTGEHGLTATPTLTAAEQQQLESKTSTTLATDPQGPRNDSRVGLKWLWGNGSTLRVRFLGGTEAQHAMARKATDEWSRYANLQFRYVDAGAAELRIAFDPSGGSWAYLGRDALGISDSRPTMNLGFPELSAALHEFGHVLGLIHENQNPNAKLPWDRPEVYRYFTGPPNNWSRATTDAILETTEISGYRSFDADSIMMHKFDGQLFTDGVARGGKQVLSASDKAFVAKLYPR